MPFGPIQPSITRRADRVGFTPYQPTVLIADDHEDSRHIARLVLESGGYRVSEARNGIEALARARSDRPDAILLDVVMPGMTGWDVTDELRKDPETSDIRILIVTALAGVFDRERSIACGCDELLTKPVKPRVLLDALRRHTGSPPGGSFKRG